MTKVVLPEKTTTTLLLLCDRGLKLGPRTARDSPIRSPEHSAAEDCIRHSAIMVLCVPSISAQCVALFLSCVDIFCNIPICFALCLDSQLFLMLITHKIIPLIGYKPKLLAQGHTLTAQTLAQQEHLLKIKL